MHDSIMSLLAVASMALAAFGVGRVAFRALRTGEEDPLAVGVWSLALGLVLVGSFLAALGLVGLLGRSVIAVLTMAAGFWGIGELLRAHAGLSQRQWWVWQGRASGVPPDSRVASMTAERDAAPARWMTHSIWALAAATCACRFLSALVPPTDIAALQSHLEIPKTWLVEGSLVYLPSNGDTRLVPAAAMWRVWALALDGGVAAQLSEWALGLLLALATVVLARSIVGRRAAWIAGAVVLLVPAVAHDMALVRDGLATATLATLLLAAWRRGTIDDRRGWFVIAGIMLAGMLGGRVVGLSLFASIAVASAVILFRSTVQRGRLSSGYAILMAAAVVAAAPLLVRAVECGLTAGPEFMAVPHQEHAAEPVRDVGFVFLVAAPGLLIARRLRGLGMLLAIACGYAVLAVLLSEKSVLRSLLPIVPVYAVALAWVGCEWRRLPRLASLVAHATLLVVLVAGASAAVLDVRDKWQVALGNETRGDYLLTHEPTYNAAALLNQLGTTRARLLSQDPRGFYFNCRVTRASDWSRAVHGDAAERNLLPEDLAAMRAAGFTHALLVTPTREATALESKQGVDSARHARSWAADSMVRLQEYVFQNGDGTLRRYTLYMLR